MAVMNLERRKCPGIGDVLAETIKLYPVAEINGVCGTGKHHLPRVSRF